LPKGPTIGRQAQKRGQIRLNEGQERGSTW